MELLSVSVGTPAFLGTWQGEAVSSGIRKHRSVLSRVTVGPTNIEGDGQADLSVHDGRDKAVYVYAADHWNWWREQHGFVGSPAAFGENLTVQGVDEHSVRIGDRFAWGSDVVLEVSQPRAPCFKLALLTGRPEIGTHMTTSGRTGWYCRVVRDGIAPTSGRIERLSSEGVMPTVHEAFAAVFHPRVRSDLVQRVLEAPSLAEIWREGLKKRLRAGGYQA